MTEMNEHEDQREIEECDPKSVSRRQFLKMAGATGVAIGLAGGLGGMLAACGKDEETTTTGGAATTASTAAPTTTAGPVTTAAPSTTAATAGPGPAEKIKVGFPVALSGFFSVQDIVCADEMKILTEMINEQGIMIKDKRYEIELLEEDIKSTFDGVSAAVNSLIYDKGVKFMIGPSAFFNPPASPITNQNKVLHLIDFSTMKPGECDGTTPYTYWTRSKWPSMVSQYDVFVQENYPNLGRKWGIIAVDDGGIPGFQTASRALFSAAKIEDVEWVGYANETQDFTPIAAKLNAVDCDAYLHLNGIVTHAGAILKGLRELGNNKPYMTCLTANTKDIQTIVGDSKLSDLTSNTTTPGSPHNSALVNELITRLQAKAGADTAVYLTHASGLYILWKLLEGAQSVDPTEVKNYFDGLAEVDSMFGTGYLSGEQTIGRKGYLTTPEPIQVLKDGKIVDAGYMPVAMPLP